MRYFQLIPPRAKQSRIAFHQAYVTPFQSKNDGSRNNLKCAAFMRWRPRRKRLLIGPCGENINLLIIFGNSAIWHCAILTSTDFVFELPLVQVYVDILNFGRPRNYYVKNDLARPSFHDHNEISFAGIPPSLLCSKSKRHDLKVYCLD